jgi:hypothetical protein
MLRGGHGIAGLPDRHARAYDGLEEFCRNCDDCSVQNQIASAKVRRNAIEQARASLVQLLLHADVLGRVNAEVAADDQWRGPPCDTSRTVKNMNNNFPMTFTSRIVFSEAATALSVC